MENFSVETKEMSAVRAERDRLLDSSDFPSYVLSERQKEVLGGVSLHHVVLDHNKKELATVQVGLVDGWREHLGNLSVTYISNGEARLSNQVATEDSGIETIVRDSLPNHIGVPDLIAEATKSVLSEPGTDFEQTWLSFASADVWVLNSDRWLGYLSSAVERSRSVISTYCGGLGRRGVVLMPDYFTNGSSLRNSYPAVGLMTEFFAIRADIARKSLMFWNNPSKGKLCYRNFHKDPRLKRFIDNGQGTVETHFRYLLSQTLGRRFSESVLLMQPDNLDETQYFRIYPEGIGYTSTHDDSIRRENVKIAVENGLDLNSFPLLKKWMES